MTKVLIQMYVEPEDKAHIKRMAKLWRCSMGQALRDIIHEHYQATAREATDES